MVSSGKSQIKPPHSDTSVEQGDEEQDISLAGLGVYEGDFGILPSPRADPILELRKYPLMAVIVL